MALPRSSSCLTGWLARCFSRLAHWSIRHPKSTLLLAVAVTLAAPGVARLKLRTDGDALVSPKDPAVVCDRSIRDKFGIQDQLVVLIRPDDTNGVFNPATVQLVRDLTAELKQIPSINPSNVLSLATEPSFHLRPGSLLHQTLLEPPMRTRAELDQLREDLRRIELYTGTFVSADGLVAGGRPARP